METNSWSVKWRPQKFKDIVGQETAVRKLMGMVKKQTVPNALLITGPSGTGKTTLARLLNRYLNCEKGNACGKCRSCLYPADSHPDFLDINAGDDRGIDSVRSLIQKARFKPQHEVRIILIDECHAYTGPAASALLKPLEEPPDNTLWILATTEPQRILSTIIGRCRRIDLYTVDPESVADRLQFIANAENISYINRKLLLEIAHITGGQVRNAIETLEGICNYVNGLKTIPKIEELSKLIKQSALSTSDRNFELICTKILLCIYSGKTAGIVSALADTDNDQLINLANRLLYMNQYLIDTSVITTRNKNVWHTAENVAFNKIINQKIGTTISLTTKLQVHASLVSLRSQMQQFAVNERFLILSVLGNLKIR